MISRQQLLGVMVRNMALLKNDTGFSVDSSGDSCVVAYTTAKQKAARFVVPRLVMSFVNNDPSLYQIDESGTASRVVKGEGFEQRPSLRST